MGSLRVQDAFVRAASMKRATKLSLVQSELTRHNMVVPFGLPCFAAPKGDFSVPFGAAEGYKKC